MALFMMLENLLPSEEICEYFNLQVPKSKKTWRTLILTLTTCCEFIITLGLQQPTTPLGIFIIMAPKKGWSNEKKIAKDYFGFLLHSLFYDYSGLVYDYN
jgi:hypothetical protein